MEHRTFKTEGILLKQHPYRESDRILTWYTRDTGKTVCLARSSKLLLAHLVCVDLLTHAELQLHYSQNRHWYIITGIKIIDSFKNLRTNFVNCVLGLQCLDYTYSLTPHGEKSHTEFGLLLNTLQSLDIDENNSYKLFINFLVNQFNVLGYKLNWKTCIICNSLLNTKLNWWFVPNEGSVVCEKCAMQRKYTSTLKLSQNIVSDISGNYNFSDIDITPELGYEISKFYGIYAAYILNNDLNSTKFNNIIYERTKNKF